MAGKFKAKNTTKTLSWPGQTLDLLLMIKSLVTGAAAFAVSALAPLSVSAAPVSFSPEANVAGNRLQRRWWR